jgi:hypothetical protein
MMQALNRNRGRLLAFALPLLVAVLSAHAALPARDSCSMAVATVPGGATELGCLPHATRVELLTRIVEPAVIAPLNRDYQLYSALHRWKARESEALAVPASNGHLAAYLDGRTIESQRSQALKESEQAIVRSEARILLLGADLKVASRAATQWIHRQPGRALPASYLQRIVDAAEAIMAEDKLLQAHRDERDDVNRTFDHQLQRVLTLQG